MVVLHAVLASLFNLFPVIILWPVLLRGTCVSY